MIFTITINIVIITVITFIFCVQVYLSNILMLNLFSEANLTVANYLADFLKEQLVQSLQEAIERLVDNFPYLFYFIYLCNIVFVFEIGELAWRLHRGHLHEFTGVYSVKCRELHCTNNEVFH